MLTIFSGIPAIGILSIENIHLVTYPFLHRKKNMIHVYIPTCIHIYIYRQISTWHVNTPLYIYIYIYTPVIYIYIQHCCIGLPIQEASCPPTTWMFRWFKQVSNGLLPHAVTFLVHPRQLEAVLLAHSLAAYLSDCTGGEWECIILL